MHHFVNPWVVVDDRIVLFKNEYWLLHYLVNTSSLTCVMEVVCFNGVKITDASPP